MLTLLRCLHLSKALKIVSVNVVILAETGAVFSDDAYVVTFSQGSIITSIGLAGDF